MLQYIIARFLSTRKPVKTTWVLARITLNDHGRRRWALNYIPNFKKESRCAEAKFRRTERVQNKWYVSFCYLAISLMAAQVEASKKLPRRFTMFVRA